QVVELAVRDGDVTLDRIGPFDDAVVGIAEADDGLDAGRGRAALRVFRAPAPVVARLLAALDLLVTKCIELLLRHVVAIRLAFVEPARDDLAIARHAVHLVDRTLVVIEAEPRHVLDDAALRLVRRAREVGVLDAQHELPAMPPRIRPGEVRRADVAEMQASRGARREPR